MKHKTDVYVGQMIKQQRVLISQSQQDLADQLGITFQQVQKYENGSNRVSASKLLEIALNQGLNVEAYFPEHHGDTVRKFSKQAVKVMDEFENLPPKQRKSISELVSVLNGS